MPRTTGERVNGAWIGALFFAVIAGVGWFVYAVVNDLEITTVSMFVCAGIGLSVGGILGWIFPRLVGGAGELFLSLLPF